MSFVPLYTSFIPFSSKSIDKKKNRSKVKLKYFFRSNISVLLFFYISRGDENMG